MPRINRVLPPGGPERILKNGKHHKHCECAKCLNAKRRLYVERVADMQKIRLPETDDQWIPVRAHFRRNPRYHSHEPALVRFIRAYVEHLMKGRST